MAEDSLRVFCSVYGYNGSVTPETEAYGLSYAEIVANYHTVDFAKDEIGDLASTTSSTSNAALSDTERSSNYDSVAYSEPGSSYNGSEASYESTEAPISQGIVASRQPTDLSSLLEDGPLYYTDYASKTFAQLKKRDLKASDSLSKRYEDGPITDATYADAWEKPTSKPASTTAKAPVSNDYENENYASYSVSGDDDTTSEYTAPGSNAQSGSNSVTKPAPTTTQTSQSSQYENDAYVTGTLTPGKPGDAYAAQDGAYSDYGTSSDGYSRDGNDNNNYTSGSIGSDYQDDDAVKKSNSGNDLGFGGLNQTQQRLMAADKHHGRTKAPTRSDSKKPLYEESQETDFFKSFSWNERWQALLERPTVTPEEIRQRAADIEELTEQFLEVAKPIVTRIVEELWLPSESKTIKPVDVGGVAGGEKYMAKQLFMKYARDNMRLRLYDGDSWAQKAALHELKSLNALIACNIPNLHFPLMACLSCYGHCVVVVSKLPLSKKTLVYGSDDVAKTIRTDREVGGLFKQAAEMLNLEPHYVTEGSTRLEKLMYGPVDIEGHKGLDGRSYIVDTARLFPPAPPIRGVRGCHLYKLLRKELVRSNPVPLSSDAFSFFGKVNEVEHNIPVTDAVNRIFDVLIPQFFALPNINEILQAGGDRITTEIHELGINIRFLGCILDYAINLSSATPDASSSPVIAPESIRGIVREMIARASKHVFFGSMRTNIRPNCGTKEECRRLAADHWNHLLFSSALHNPTANIQSDPTKYHLTNEAVENWWKTQLIPTLKQRFVFFNGNGRWMLPLVAELEQAANRVISYELILQSLLEAPAAVFARSTHLTGVIFHPSIVSSITAKGNAWFSSNRSLADTEHVLRIEVLDKRVKFMPFLSASFGDSERFYLSEISNRISALGANHPQVAISYRHLGELYADQPGNEENARSSYDRAAAIYRSYHSKDPEALVRDLGEIMNLQADLLLKYDRLQLAQHKLFELLELYRPVTYGGGGDDEDEEDSTCASKTPSTGSTTSSDLRPTSLVMADGKSIAFVRKITAGGDLEDASNVLDKLAFVKLKLGSIPDASNCFALAYECKLKIFGTEQCWQVARTLNGQAQLLFASGQTLLAKEMCIKVHKITIETRGPGHSEVGIAKDNLARVLSAEGAHDDADELYKSALEIKVASLGEKHSFVAMSWDNMASNRLERLLALARGLSTEISTPTPEPSPQTPQTPFLITKSNVNPADLEDISLLYEKSLEAIDKSLGKLHSAYGISASNLAVTKAYLRQWKLAERLADEALNVLSSTLGIGNPSSMVVSANLNYVRGILSKSADEQQSLSIESDAMRRVYHSSLASSTPSGGSASATSNKSRIPDKIKQLLEKKGIAVTEENAAKVQELLRRKREAAMPGATPLAMPPSNVMAPSRNASGTLARKPVDPYENAPDSYAELPTPIAGLSDERRDSQYENYGDSSRAADGYSPLPAEPAARGDLLANVRSGTALRKVSEDSKRKSLQGDYENSPQLADVMQRRTKTDYHDESDEEGGDWEERRGTSSAPKPAPATTATPTPATTAANESDEEPIAAADAKVNAIASEAQDLNQLMGDLEHLREQGQSVDTVIHADRDLSGSKHSKSSSSVFERVSAFFSNLIKSSEKEKQRDASQGLSRSSPSGRRSTSSSELNQSGSAIGTSVTRASSRNLKAAKPMDKSSKPGSSASPAPAMKDKNISKKRESRKKAHAEADYAPQQAQLNEMPSSSVSMPGAMSSPSPSSTSHIPSSRSMASPPSLEGAAEGRMSRTSSRKSSHSKMVLNDDNDSSEGDDMASEDASSSTGSSLAGEGDAEGGQSHSSPRNSVVGTLSLQPEAEIDSSDYYTSIDDAVDDDDDDDEDKSKKSKKKRSAKSPPKAKLVAEVSEPTSSPAPLAHSTKKGKKDEKVKDNKEKERKPSASLSRSFTSSSSSSQSSTASAQPNFARRRVSQLYSEEEKKAEESLDFPEKSQSVESEEPARSQDFAPPPRTKAKGSALPLLRASAIESKSGAAREEESHQPSPPPPPPPAVESMPPPPPSGAAGPAPPISLPSPGPPMPIELMLTPSPITAPVPISPSVDVDPAPAVHAAPPTVQVAPPVIQAAPPADQVQAAPPAVNSPFRRPVRPSTAPATAPSIAPTTAPSIAPTVAPPSPGGAAPPSPQGGSTPSSPAKAARGGTGAHPAPRQTLNDSATGGSKVEAAPKPNKQARKEVSKNKAPSTSSASSARSSFGSVAPSESSSQGYGGQAAPPQGYPAAALPQGYGGQQGPSPAFLGAQSTATIGGGGAYPPTPSLAPQFPGGQMMPVPQNTSAIPQQQAQSSFALSKLNRGYESNSGIYSYGGKRSADPSMWQTAMTHDTNEEAADQLIKEARRSKQSYSSNKAPMPPQPAAEIDDLGDLDDLDLDEINDLLDDGDASSARAVPNKGASWGWGAI